MAQSDYYYRFSIVIVTWNALHHLKNYLPSVAATDYPDFEIVIADNNSTDGTRQWVREHYPHAVIAPFDDNYGYCGGNNRAVPHTSGSILLFLNNDVRLEPGWLHGLNRMFNQYPEMAAAQPKMLDDRSPNYFEYAGAAGGLMDKYGFPFCRGRIFDTLEEDKGQYDEGDAPIFWASGAALAIKKKVFENAGGFDEDFEFHMEEIDLCWRLWNQGYSVRYCPESTVYHLGGGSLSRENPRKVYYNFRNNLYMLVKNWRTRDLWLRMPIRMILDSLAMEKFFNSLSFREAWAVFRAYLSFWGNLFTSLKKRRNLQKKRKVAENPPVMASFSLVFQYFLRKRKSFTQLPKSNIPKSLPRDSK